MLASKLRDWLEQNPQPATGDGTEEIDDGEDGVTYPDLRGLLAFLDVTAKQRCWLFPDF